MEREQITVRLPIELKQKIQQESERKGYTAKDLIIFIVHQYFQNIEQE